MEEKNKIPIGSAPKSDPIPFGFGTPTSDYNRLRNRPKINGTTIEGDKKLKDYGYDTLSNVELEELFDF